jgi:hypothetical protein
MEAYRSAFQKCKIDFESLEYWFCLKMSVERLDSFLNMLPANFVPSRAENILQRADWDVSKALDIYFRENCGSSGKLTSCLVSNGVNPPGDDSSS